MMLLLLFWSSVILIAHTYLLYPLMMYIVGRVCAGRAVAPREAGPLPTVAVVVAAFNEEKHIGARIRNLLELDYPPELLNVHIGSDGSSDRTVALARGSDDPRVHVHAFTERRGKASVLNDVITGLRDEIVVFTDANTEFDMGALRALVRNFSTPEVGAVSGELRLRHPSGGDNQDSRYWQLETSLKRGESRVGGILGANGGIYAIRRALYRPLLPDTVIDDFTIVMDIAARGHRTLFDSAALAFEDTPRGIDDEFRRRVRIGIGNYQAFFRHPEWWWRASWSRRFTYASHKVLRWFTPHLLIVALVASIALADQPLYAWLLAMQFGVLAMLGLALAVRGRIDLPRPLGMAVFVFALNVAFLIGFWRYIGGNFAGHWRRTERT